MTYEELQQRYEFRREIIATNFSKVYKAWDTKFECFVVIKISSVEQGKYRLRDEIKLIKQLPEHSNIATYIDYETYGIPEDGEFDIAIMEFYEQGSLRNVIDSCSLSYEEKVSVLNQILSGIHYLHEHHIVHRDLKPENILIAKQDGAVIPKITDFGISKGIEGTNANTVCGTPLYAAPEQMGGKDYKKSVDLWSFGIIACELFTGEIPFKGYPYQLPETIGAIPEPWQTLIRQCVEPDASKRIGSVSDCRLVLNANPPVPETPSEVIDSGVKQGAIAQKADNNQGIVHQKPPKDQKHWLVRTIGIAGILLLLYLFLPQMKALLTASQNKEEVLHTTAETIPKEQKDAMANREKSEEEAKVKERTETASAAATTNTPPAPADRPSAKAKVAQEVKPTNMEKKEDEFVVLMEDKIPMIEVRGDYHFKIGKYEITQEQWKMVMSDLPIQRFESARNPVHNVSWREVDHFIGQLNRKTGRNYRLPTVAEWKYAAKGGVRSNAFLYSGSNEADEVSVYNNNIRSSLQPVGSKIPNELGIYDMSGNVSEWCQGQMICGGNWFSKADDCLIQASARRATSADSKIGFRLIMDIN